jgi:hypothetical protein
MLFFVGLVHCLLYLLLIIVPYLSVCLCGLHVGSVDMKDFLLTMIAFRPDPEPKTSSREPLNAMDRKVFDSGANLTAENSMPNKPNPILEAEKSMSSMDDQCRLYFNVFDINETGTIDMEELKLVVGSLLREGKSVSTDMTDSIAAVTAAQGGGGGENGNGRERSNSRGGVHQTMPGMCNIEELFKVIDIDKTGQINYEEFEKFYDAVLTFSTRRSVM